MKQIVVQQVGWHGATFGSALAMAISFNVNHSVGWAMLRAPYRSERAILPPTVVLWMSQPARTSIVREPACVSARYLTSGPSR